MSGISYVKHYSESRMVPNQIRHMKSPR